RVKPHEREPAELLTSGARRRRRREEVGAALVVLGPEPDVEVDARGAREALAEICPDGLAGDAADHLADQEALSIDVVTMAPAGFPPRRLGGERRCHRVPLRPRP